jgi:hypothetical protein
MMAVATDAHFREMLAYLRVDTTIASHNRHFTFFTQENIEQKFRRRFVWGVAGYYGLRGLGRDIPGFITPHSALSPSGLPIIAIPLSLYVALWDFEPLSDLAHGVAANEHAIFALLAAHHLNGGQLPMPLAHFLP